MITVEPTENPLCVWNLLKDEVAQYYEELYGDPSEAGEQDMSIFVPPYGRMFIALDEDDHPCGMGSWVWLSCQGYHPTEDVPAAWPYRTAELKRLFVRKQYRGRGVGKLLEDARHADAFAEGAEMLVMETSARQVESVNLRKKYGYHPVEPFGPYQSLSDNTYWGKVRTWMP